MLTYLDRIVYFTRKIFLYEMYIYNFIAAGDHGW